MQQDRLAAARRAYDKAIAPELDKLNKAVATAREAHAKAVAATSSPYVRGQADLDYLNAVNRAQLRPGRHTGARRAAQGDHRRAGARVAACP